MSRTTVTLQKNYFSEPILLPRAIFVFMRTSSSFLNKVSLNPLDPKPDEQNLGFFELQNMKKLQTIIGFDLDKILSPEKVQSDI